MAGSDTSSSKLKDKVSGGSLVSRKDEDEDLSRVTSFITSTSRCQETTDNYNTWASNYDKDLEGTYRAHVIAAEALEEAVPEEQRGELRVLDVGAGTGKVGQELVRLGFKHLDALEPAAAMLEVLKSTQVYNRTFNEYVGVGKNTVPSDSYDVVVVAGAMVKGHIPTEGVADLVRMAKPGGLVCISMRKEFAEEGGDYHDLESFLSTLEERRAWTKVFRKVVPNYFYNHDGLVYMYRVM